MARRVVPLFAVAVWQLSRPQRRTHPLDRHGPERRDELGREADTARAALAPVFRKPMPDHFQELATMRRLRCVRRRARS